LNLWRYVFILPCPVTMAVKLGVGFILSSFCGRFPFVLPLFETLYF
jgi:hypothetical protein